MAVSDTSSKRTGSPDLWQLAPAPARAAGLISIVLGVVGITCLIMYLATTRNPGAGVVVLVTFELAMLVMGVAAGTQLLLQRVWAQRMLLGLWLAVATAELILLVSDLVGGAATWWTRTVPETAAAFLRADGSAIPTWGVWPASGPLALVLIPVVAVSVLLVVAARKGSRLRYGSTAAVAVAVAISLLFVINTISQKDYVRRSVETLGRYTLSERSKRIVKNVKAPIRLTCVYASPQKKYRSGETRPRVLELLNEMHEAKSNIEVVSVITDAAKQRLFDRISRQSAERAEDHGKLLEQFLRDAAEVTKQTAALEREWDKLAGKSYMDLWGLPTQIAEGLKSLAGEWKTTGRDVRQQMDGLPDYAKLTERIRGLLDGTKKNMEEVAAFLKIAGTIPDKIDATRDDVLKSVDAAVDAAKQMQQVVGGPADKTDPKDPAAVLKKFVAATDKAIQASTAAAKKLDSAAGQPLTGYITRSRAWKMTLSREPIIVVAGQQIYGQNTVSGVFVTGGATILARLKMLAENNLRAANVEYQVKTVKQLRGDVNDVTRLLLAGRKAARLALKRLADMDEATADIIKSGKPFEPIVKPVEQLLKQVDALPAIETTTFAEDIKQPNIIIIEVGDKQPQVVTFDEVWPLKMQRYGMATDPDQIEPRSFNGDSAISSKILAMTQEPFATVLITYLPPSPQAQQMRQMVFTPRNIPTLRERLEKANLKVEEWDLSKDFPSGADSNDPNADDTTARVLLILPPTPEMPQMMFGPRQAPSGFGRLHLAKIRKAIDSGTSAIFLAQWTQTGPFGMARYPLGDYLRKDWGIDVKTRYLVIPAARAQSEPGKYNIAIKRFNHLPLSNFSDHPIGLPLQGQRTLWRMLCPIERLDSPPPGVETTALLTIPETWDHTWATSDVEKVFGDYYAGEGSYVEPNYPGGDIRAPMDVAVAATRRADDKQGTRAARIVVLSITPGLMDPYISDRVPVGDHLAKTQDPPRANADVVVNSVYWLSAHKDYIAAGPTRVKPVAYIGIGELRLLWGLCVVALPACVLAVGGIVLLVRRR